MFNSTNGCCFDAPSKNKCAEGIGADSVLCKHELCSRAKTSGISFTELDTIKWYDTRIRLAKTQRMETALVKQREVELARIRQSEDEDRAVRARKQAKKGQAQPKIGAESSNNILVEDDDPRDVGTMIFQTRIALTHAHKYNAMVHAQKRNEADLARCTDEVSLLNLQKTQQGSDYDKLVDRLNKAEMRSKTLVEDAQWYTDMIAEAIQASSRHKQSTFWRDFDLNFDSSDPDMIELCSHLNGLTTELGMDVVDNPEHAYAALRRCMSFPRDQMPRPVQKTIDDIQKIIVKTQKYFKYKKPQSSDASDPDIPDCFSLLGDLRTSLCRLSAPQSLQGDNLNDPSTVYSNLLNVETEALCQLYQEYARVWLLTPDQISLSLRDITATFVGKSPMPHLTEPMLDVMTSAFIDMSSARTLIEDLEDTSDQILDAKLGGMVFARAERKSDWLMEALEEVEARFETVYGRRLPKRILLAMQRVRVSVEDRLRSIGSSAQQPQQDTIQSAGNTPEGQLTRAAPSSESPTAPTASVMPARRKLLPRGERYQNHYETTTAAMAVAWIGPQAAKKMSSFCILQQKAYERALLPLPPEVLDRQECVRRIASSKAGSQLQKHGNRSCSHCFTARDRAGQKTSKFAEDFLAEKEVNEFEIPCDGPPEVTDEEIFGYLGATVERIQSIARGEAKLEYLCRIAYKLGLEADAAMAVGNDWLEPFRCFEELFCYYSPLPHELKIALDHAKGRIWRSSECLKTYPIADRKLIEDVLTITEKIRAKELTFTNNDDSWRDDVPDIARASEEETLAETAKYHSAVWNQVFSDPTQLENFLDVLRDRPLSSDRLSIPAFDAAANDMRQLLKEGKIEVCKELLLAITRPYLEKTDELPVPEQILSAALAELAQRTMSSEETIKEAMELRQKRLLEVHFEKAERQTAAIQAQIEAIRQLQDSPEPAERSPTRVYTKISAPMMTQADFLKLFKAYDENVNAVTDFPPLTRQQYNDSDHPMVDIACRIQLQCFDSVRMMQLMAENRGWTEMAKQMGESLTNCGLVEDAEGHFPDGWGNDDESDDGEGVDGREVVYPMLEAEELLEELVERGRDLANPI
jgi:hypothetical protein